MFGNWISFVFIISLNLERNERNEYILAEIWVQPEILDLLQSLPISAGL